MVKLFLSLILLFFLGTNLRAQSFDTSTISRKEIRSFFSDIVPLINTHPGYLLSDKPLDDYKIFIEKILPKDSSFSKDDIDFIKLQHSQSNLINWDSTLIDSVTILKDVSIERIFNSQELKKNWLAFYKKFGGRYHQLSIPLFSKDKNICILFLNHYCGSLCGQGEIRIFKKSVTGWTLHKRIKRWVS